MQADCSVLSCLHDSFLKLGPRLGQQLGDLRLHADEGQSVYSSIRAEGIHLASPIACEPIEPGRVFLHFIASVPLVHLFERPNLEPEREIRKFPTARTAAL